MSNKLISFDFAIKHLLKHKSDYELVEGFISALLKDRGIGPIKIITLFDTESNKERYSQKKSLADLIVEDENHHKYIVEIERQEVKNFVHKACFNTSRLIIDQVRAGEDFLGINKVFHISLLYFKVGAGPIYHGKTIVEEIETKEKLTVHIEDPITKEVYDAINVLPEYIFISVPQFDDKIDSEIDEWLYVMKNEEVKANFKSPYMKKLSERLSIIKMSREEKDEYDKYIKDVATYNNAIDTAEAKGVAKGKAEGKAEVAKILLAQNIDIQIISVATGLTKEQIEKLKD